MSASSPNPARKRLSALIAALCMACLAPGRAEAQGHAAAPRPGGCTANFQEDDPRAHDRALRGGSAGCLVCHGDLENAQETMPFQVGCTFCHGGDAWAQTKEAAHVQPQLPVIMDNTVPPLDYDLPYQQFVNPSNLRVVQGTCGPCHWHQVDSVMKGLMTTAAGHYAGGLYQNGVVDTKTPIYGTFAVTDDDGYVPLEAGAVASLADLITYDPLGDPSLVSTHFAAVPAQACARCHLWSRGKGYRGAVGADGVYRADGCAACHMLYANDGRSLSADASIDHNEQGHPMYHLITKAIPTDQCLHCHHRGARIGLSFTGRAQMPPRLPSGPGVPGTTTEIFNGNYHYTDAGTNPPDIHGQMGMHCIDCHTRAEVMGDANIYGHMDQATKIGCRICHGTPDTEGSLIDADGNTLNNAVRGPDGTVTVTSKVDGQLHVARQVKDLVNPFSPLYNHRASCAMNANHIKDQGGLECYACHAAWTPNCFGCHFERNEQLMGRNLVTREWEVGKVRTNNKVFESLKHFSLGPNSSGKIAPYIVGCQPIADVTAPDGSKILDFKMPSTVNGLSGLALQPVHAHTVRGVDEVRTCAECHRAPPSLGLGSGNYTLARTHAFVAGTEGVRVFERWTDPTNPAPAATLSGGAALAVASVPNVIEGTADYLHVACGTNGVSTFDLRAGLPGAPAATIGGINAIDVSYAARYLYVVDQGVGVQIYDTQDPVAAQYVATVPIPTALRVVPWGIHLFVPAGPAGLAVVDISDHAAPVTVATLGGMNAVDVTLYAHFQMGRRFAARAYVADPDFGARVVDLLPDVDAPALVDGLPLPGASGLDTYTRYVMADATTPSREHDYLYVAAGAGGLHVFDITDPDAIVEVGAVTDLGGTALDVDVASQMAPPGVDDYAVVANSTEGLQVVDVTDPKSPVWLTSVAAAGASRAFVEVQPLDRFIDEQGQPLKENSHPGTGVFSRADIVRILSADISNDCEFAVPHDCCGTGHGAGCNDLPIETCVCQIDPYCCSSDWDRVCADLVTDGTCGSCEVAGDCQGNGIPDGNEMTRTETLLSADFDYAFPPGWSATGLWHVTGQCAVADACEPIWWAYFGRDLNCDFDIAIPVQGDLTAAAVTIPLLARSATLRYCSAYEGERGPAPSGYDAAWVTVNDVLVDDVGFNATAMGTWETRTVDLSAYAGQTVRLAWHFDSIDAAANATLGWQVDQAELLVEVSNDCNYNRLPDDCDILFGLSQDLDTNGIPDDCELRGDYDFDGDVDLTDFARLAACLTGPGATSPPPGCGPADFIDSDLDPDNDVDLSDLAAFQQLFTGP